MFFMSDSVYVMRVIWPCLCKSKAVASLLSGLNLWTTNKQQISINCRKLKPKKLQLWILSVVKPKGKQTQQPIITKKISREANENLKWKRANCVQGGKTRVIQSRLIIILYWTVWESGATFLDQSHNEVNQNLSNPELLLTLYWKFFQ